MERDEDCPVTISPDNPAILLVLLGLGFIWVRFFTVKPDFFVFRYLTCIFFFNLVGTFYLLHYFFIYSKILVFKDKITLPNTSDSGFPSAFIFRKKEINMDSITKIIKYHPKHVSPRLAFHGAKISIISKVSGNIQLSYGFFGGGSLDNLIMEILKRNENVQVIE